MSRCGLSMLARRAVESLSMKSLSSERMTNW